MTQYKRAYEPPSPEDGQRILVDRLWPRGCRKDSLALHAWLPDLAPSTALRKAFKGGEIGFATFRQRYRDELAGHPEHWWALLEMAGRGTLTLIYAAQDERQNNARVLAEWLEEEMQRLERPSSPACLAGELDGRINGDG
ncbi:MAG: MarR family transcriptional regulator [Pseudomonas sp. K35]|nr:MAG: MarR family transcriptional regulator [Pseudomonas sp. K35]